VMIIGCGRRVTYLRLVQHAGMVLMMMMMVVVVVVVEMLVVVERTPRLAA